MIKNVGIEHIFYTDKHNKIVIVVEGSCCDFLFIYHLETLKKCCVDLDHAEWFDSFPWNNLYDINKDFIFCLHDNGIYAINIGNLESYSSNIIHYVTEFENKKDTYSSEELNVDENNIISHVLIYEDGYKKIIKIKFAPDVGQFSFISEENINNI